MLNWKWDQTHGSGFIVLSENNKIYFLSIMKLSRSKQEVSELSFLPSYLFLLTSKNEIRYGLPLTIKLEGWTYHSKQWHCFRKCTSHLGSQMLGPEKEQWGLQKVIRLCRGGRGELGWGVYFLKIFLNENSHPEDHKFQSNPLILEGVFPFTWLFPDFSLTFSW